MNPPFSRATKSRRAALLFLSIAFASVGVSRVVGAEPVTVQINHFQFEPRELTVAPGTTVSWVNHDQTIHNIVSTDTKLTSPGLDTDDRYSFVFDHEGDYVYHCALHPQMVGVVHVRPAMKPTG